MEERGRQAIEQFRTHRPDITLMDLQMPLMSGGEAILAIRKEFPNARIIVLTTYGRRCTSRPCVQRQALAAIS